MSFSVEPVNISAYATKMMDLYDDVAFAKLYLQARGDFTFHQSGLIGVLSGQHAAWVENLEEMLNHLLSLTYAASRALDDVAIGYMETDDQTAARIDASYPVAPRAPLDRK